MRVRALRATREKSESARPGSTRSKTCTRSEVRANPPVGYLLVTIHVSFVPTYDRTTINSWEDVEFRAAVKATRRKKLIMTALWTEACLTFPALDALDEGYEVYVVTDAVGGTSVTAHEAALRRIEQAGGKMISVVQLFCELQRDWALVQQPFPRS